MATGFLEPQSSRNHRRSGFHDALRLNTGLGRADGYDYNNVGRSPERMKTELSSRLLGPTSSSNSKLPFPARVKEAFPDLTRVTSPENQHDEAISYIGYRPAGSRRAKVPDLEKGTSDGALTGTKGHGTQIEVGSRSSRMPSGGSVSEADADAVTKYIKLGWTMAQSAAKCKFLLNVAAPINSAQDADPQRRVLWR